MTDEESREKLVLIDEADEIWMMVGDAACRLAERGVHGELFESAPHPVERATLDALRKGPEVCAGSCLVRGDGSLGIFFVTGYPDTRRYRVENFETFTAYGFRLDAVRNIPVLVLEQIPLGRSLALAA